MRSALVSGVFLLALIGCGGASEPGAGAQAGAAPSSEDKLSGWRLADDESRLAFVSIKAGEVAETHTFRQLSGAMDESGIAEVTIDLASVETQVDIRNERMREIFFETAQFPDATVTADVPLEGLADLEVGARTGMVLPIAVTLHGMTAEYDADVFVSRLADGRVLVETASPVLTSAGDFGLLQGVERLREIAGLPSISPAVPVTVSLVFEQ